MSLRRTRPLARRRSPDKGRLSKDGIEKRMPKYRAEDEEHGCSAKLYVLLRCYVGAAEL
jgi:hypothetical protein